MKVNVVVNSKVLPQSQGYVSSLIVGIEFVCVYIGECVFDGNVCIVPCNSLKKRVKTQKVRYLSCAQLHGSLVHISTEFVSSTQKKKNLMRTLLVNYFRQ